MMASKELAEKLQTALRRFVTVDHAGFVVLLNPDLDADFIVEFRELKEYLR